MKITCLAFIFLAFIIANLDAYAGKLKEMDDRSAAKIFLGYLKRQNKDLARTIVNFEEMQDDRISASPKQKFWLQKIIEDGVDANCCGFCPGSGCSCCQRVPGIGYCCDFKSNAKQLGSDENEN